MPRSNVERRGGNAVLRPRHDVLKEQLPLVLELEELYQNVEARRVESGRQMEDGGTLQCLVLVGVVLVALGKGDSCPINFVKRFHVITITNANCTFQTVFC